MQDYAKGLVGVEVFAKYPEPGLIGVVAALLPSGAPLGFVAILGVLALLGILIRNAIILIREIEVQLARGLTRWQAVFHASDSRVRPILPTVAAASLALIPIARQMFRGPMACAMRGGIIAGTLITLGFAPALYCAVFRVKPARATCAPVELFRAGAVFPLVPEAVGAILTATPFSRPPMDQILQPPYAPITFALGLLLAFLALELVALLMGLSLHGAEADLDISPEIADLHAQFDVAPDTETDLTTLLEASAALHNAEVAPQASGGLDWLGLRGVPLMIWLASVLLGFGLGGYLLHGLSSVFGFTLPDVLAIPLAAVAALAFSRGFAGAFAKLVPRMKTLRPAQTGRGHRQIQEGTLRDRCPG